MHVRGVCFLDKKAVFLLIILTILYEGFMEMPIDH